LKTTKNSCFENYATRRRVHLAIHHQLSFIGILDDQLSRAGRHRRTEHRHQSNRRPAALLPVTPVIRKQKGEIGKQESKCSYENKPENRNWPTATKNDRIMAGQKDKEGHRSVLCEEGSKRLEL
jgi:hypothetical protein